MSDISSVHHEQQLKELISFTKSTDDELGRILSTFEWTLENLAVKENENYVLCPFNPGHRLPEKNLQHVVACQKKNEGYDEFDVELSEPVLSPDNPYTIKFDSRLQAQILLSAKQKDPKMLLESYEYNACRRLAISFLRYYYALLKIGAGDRLIPRTSSRIFADFTNDERAAIYNYVIANTQKIDIGQDIADLNKTKDKGEQKSISYLELLAQERNLKRRRTKHRGVHTNKKSHVEVMREVIEQQMEMFKEYLSEQNVFEGENKETTQEIVGVSDQCGSTTEEFKTSKCLSDQDTNYYRKEKTIDRHTREEARGDSRNYYSERKKSNHNSHKRDKYRSSEERHVSKERTKHRHRSKDRSKHRDRSRGRERSRSKNRYRYKSSERRESRNDYSRSRKRSRSKNRR